MKHIFKQYTTSADSNNFDVVLIIPCDGDATDEPVCEYTVGVDNNPFPYTKNFAYTKKIGRILLDTDNGYN